MGPEDPWEKEMASHSSFLAWEILRIEEPGGLQPMGSQKCQIQLTDQAIFVLVENVAHFLFSVH